METKKPENVSYYVHESEMARQERHVKRLWVLVIIMFAALVITNAGWIWYESQFEDIVMTQDATTDGGGDAIIHGVVGDYYGQGETEY